MVLPVSDIHPPAVLSGQNNGRLVLSILRQTPGLNGGPTVTLVETAARCWRALSGTAQADGIILQITSPADSYRPLAVQKAIFATRYTPVRQPGRPTKTCNGVTYWQLPNTATAACPGTSNHGWGIACDIANASGKRLDWLLANAARFGWSWEIQSEPWHIRNVTGDNIPPAVLEYEEADPLAGITERDAQALIWRVEAILHNRPTVTGGPTKGEKNDLHDALAAVGLTGQDLAAVKDSANAGAKAGALAALLAGLTVDSTVSSVIKPPA
jgi:hypothetical protein